MAILSMRIKHGLGRCIFAGGIFEVAQCIIFRV